MTAGVRAKCFLCQMTAREGALKPVGQLWTCADGEKCDERRAERVRARDTGMTPGAAK